MRECFADAKESIELKLHVRLAAMDRAQNSTKHRPQQSVTLTSKV
jgi:hypothetical protein